MGKGLTELKIEKGIEEIKADDKMLLTNIEPEIKRTTTKTLDSMNKTLRFCSVFRPMAIGYLRPLMAYKSVSSANAIVAGIRERAPLTEEEAQSLRDAANRLCREKEFNKVIIMNAIDYYTEKKEVQNV